VPVIRLENFSTSCNFPKYQYARNKGYSVDWIKLDIPAIEIKFENFEQLIQHRRIRNLHVQNADLLVYKDKRVPEPEKSPLILREILAKDDVSFYVDTVSIVNSDITYEEWEKKGKETGNVTFNAIDATVSDLITFDHQPENPARLTASCLLFNESRLYTDISFSSTYYGNTLVKGTLKPMSLSTFNQMLRPVAFVEIRSGQLHALDFEFSYDRKNSTGVMHLEYSDLELGFMKDPSESNGFRRFINSLLSNVVSNFIIRSENLSGSDKFRTGEISFERNTNKSMFNYWWKSIFSGMKSSVGISEEKNKKEKK
jgi:hypothetical protein